MLDKLCFWKKQIPDWQDSQAIPKEVISKKELNRLEKTTIKTLRNNNALAPQALHYIFNFIDARFNGNNFDVDTYFHKKQSTLDELYAKGLGEVHADISDYSQLIARRREISERYFKCMEKLGAEPTSTPEHIDDSEALRKEIEQLPTNLNWSK